MKVEPMCFAASEPGRPGYCAAVVDDGLVKTARLIHSWRQAGRTVTRVTVVEANVGLSLYHPAKVQLR